jgi:hypothetical protein
VGEEEKRKRGMRDKRKRKRKKGRREGRRGGSGRGEEKRERKKEGRKRYSLNLDFLFSCFLNPISKTEIPSPIQK